MLGGIPPIHLTRFAQIQNPAPACVFVVLDEHEQTIEDGCFGIGRNPYPQWINLPSDRHGAAVNLSFADGHVSRFRFLWPKKFVGYDQSASPSQDLQDLRRLQELLPSQP
jgi:prepilin-type processing-associated H-X9-DG protein